MSPAYWKVEAEAKERATGEDGLQSIRKDNIFQNQYFLVLCIYFWRKVNLAVTFLEILRAIT
jgi:hypothetical protein